MYDTAPTAATKLAKLSNALIAIGIALPGIAAFVDIGTGADAGKHIARAGVAALIALAAIGGLMKTRSEMQKACARLAIGVALIVWAASAIVASKQDAAALRQSEKNMIGRIMQAAGGQAPAPVRGDAAAPISDSARNEIAFMDGIGEIILKHLAAMAALEKKFQALDTGSIMTAGSLTSAKAIAASRVSLKRLDELILERDAMIRAYLLKSDNHIRDSVMSDADRVKARADFEQSSKQSRLQHAELSAVQKALVTDMFALLDFAQSRLHATSLQNGNMMFSSEKDLAKFNQLHAAVNGTAKREENLVQRMAAHQAQQVAKMKNMQKQSR